MTLPLMIAFNNCQNFQATNDGLVVAPSAIPEEEPLLRIVDGENTFESERQIGKALFSCHSYGLESQASDYYQFELRVRSLESEESFARGMGQEEVLNQVVVKESQTENQFQFVSTLKSENDRVLKLDHHEKNLTVEYEFILDSQGVEVLQANISYKNSVKYPLECSL
jgi:hypothetical protein